MKGSGSPRCGWRDVVVKNSDLVYSNAVKSQTKSPITKAKARVPVVSTIVSRLSVCNLWMNYSDCFFFVTYITHALTMHTLAYTGQYRDIAYTCIHILRLIIMNFNQTLLYNITTSYYYKFYCYITLL